MLFSTIIERRGVSELYRMFALFIGSFTQRRGIDKFIEGVSIYHRHRDYYLKAKKKKK